MRDDEHEGDGPISLGQGEAKHKAASGKAIEVLIADGRVPIWIPISCIHDDSEVYDLGHTGKVIVKRWWADDHGLSDVSKKGKRR